MAKKKAKMNQLVEIVWSDPSGNEMNIRDLEEATKDPEDSLSQFLVKTHCYGWIVKEDMEAILLGYSIDASGLIRFKTIPKPLTCEPIISYYRNDRINLIDYYKKKCPVGKKRRLVEVAWLGSGIKEINVSNVDEVLNKPLIDLLDSNHPFNGLLVTNYSYGAVFAEDEDAVLLKHFENELGERELQAIPRGVIQKITPFYQSGRTNSVVENTRKAPDSDGGDGELVVSDEDVAAAMKEVLG